MTQMRPSIARAPVGAVAELCVVAPQFIAYRVARTAMASIRHDAGDHTEFLGMGSERIAAFGESWSAMILEMCRWNRRLADAFLSATANRGVSVVPELLRSVHQGQGVAFSVLIVSRSLKPIRNRIVANAVRAQHGAVEEAASAAVLVGALERESRCSRSRCSSR
jgi:hypothetical protein